MPAQRRKRTLILGFVLSILILLVSSTASYKSITELLNSLQWVEHTSDVEQTLSNVVSLMKDVETGQRGFLLTGRDRFLEPYNTGKDSVWSFYDRAKRLTEDNQQQQKTFDTLSGLLKEKLALVDATIESKKGRHEVTVDSLERGKVIMDSIRLVVRTMVGREQVLMVTRTGKFNTFSKYTPLILITGSVLALLITVVFYRRIRSDYAQNLALENALIEKDAAIQQKITRIDAIANEIAKGNYNTRVEDDDLR